MSSKRYGWLLLLALAILTPNGNISVAADKKKASDGIVAVVNGTMIRQGDLDREIISLQQRLMMAGRPVDKSRMPQLRKMAMESLINHELLYQESLNKGVEIEEAVVDAEITKIVQKFPNEKAYKEALEKMNTSEDDLKSQLKKRMAIQQYVQKEFFDKIDVPEEKIKAFYEENLDSFKQPEQVWASHILIKLEPGQDISKKKEARKKIEEIQKKLKKGESFKALAKKYSDCPSGAKGGDLGYFPRGKMVKPFEDAAFSLSPGQISNIVETPFGYHLIQVIEKKPESTESYIQAKIKIMMFLKNRETQEKLNVHIKELRDKARVDVLLEDNS